MQYRQLATEKVERRVARALLRLVQETTSPEPFAVSSASLRGRKDGRVGLGDHLFVTASDLPGMLVSGAREAMPAAARVFTERGMGCVGCTFARFETLAEVARAYGNELSVLAASLADLCTTISASEGLMQ